MFPTSYISWKNKGSERDKSTNHEDSTNQIFGHGDNGKSNSADLTSVGLKQMLSSVSLRILRQLRRLMYSVDVATLISRLMSGLTWHLVSVTSAQTSSSLSSHCFTKAVSHCSAGTSAHTTGSYVDTSTQNSWPVEKEDEGGFNYFARNFSEPNEGMEAGDSIDRLAIEVM